MNKRRIIVTLTQEPDAQSYRVSAPLIGTVRLSIGEVVSRERVSEWLTEPLITVRIVGLTPSAETDAQLDLFSLETPKKRRALNKPAPQSLPLAIAK